MGLSQKIKRIIPYTYRIPEYTFIIYFFALSFYPFDSDVFRLMCLLVVASCWILRMISEEKLLFVKTSLNIPICAFLICSLLASLYSVSRKDSLHTLWDDYLMYFVLFFFMVNTIQGAEQVRRIIKTMLIICGLVCAYGLYGYYSGIAIYAGRLVATFEYHSRIAKYISLLLPVAVCLFFYYKDFWNRFYLILFMCVCGISLILTMSRTSWVAIFIVIFFISFAVRKKYIAYIFAGLCVVLICVLPSRYISHAKTIAQVKDYFKSEKIIGERLLCWKASLEMIKDHPILGIGIGSRVFRNAYQKYGLEIKGEETQQKKEVNQVKQKKDKTEKKVKPKKVDKLSHSHNILLSICVSTGIIGLLVFLWLFATIFYKAITAWLSLPEGYEKALLLGITASLITIFLHGMTDSFWKKPDALFLWYIIGLLFVIVRNAKGTVTKIYL
ncbi:MAG: hypothetical protein A2W74_07655 [Planctomycetes bacterium RIFCSPLOWO2_12_38_17]|nr:MAG: hypothetical protein A2W74_07655 [Planctomycetes bacterium RIFCSPLOWO2_12_38_17]